MKKFNTIKELREAYEKYLGIKVYSHNRTAGIQAYMDYGIKDEIEYVEGFGWAIV